MYQDKEKKPRLIEVVIVEDDEDDYIILRDFLEDIRTSLFDITWASSYDQALELLSNLKYDVCLLDYRLGVHDGLEMLNELKSQEIDIPVIFLTGQGEYVVDIQAMKAGAADYIVKEEITSSLLERSIRYSLERARTARELRKAHEELEEKVRQRTAQLTDANSELQKASEKIQTFAYSISHDLKNPTISLLGLTRRLHDNYSHIFDEKGREYCEHIFKAGERILSLVEEINIYISEKEMPLKVMKLQLTELIKEIRDEFSDQVNGRKIKVIGPEEVQPIRADRLSMIRVLRNLIENALKYGGDRLSYIEVGLEETDEDFVISVKDDGKGLKKNPDKDIFLPFERMDSSDEIEGCGMGLAIVKEIAEKHKGKIWAGEPSDEGAVFYISISRTL